MHRYPGAVRLASTPVTSSPIGTVKKMRGFLITVVVGARPNFMKIAPLVRAFNARKPSALASGID